MADKLRLRADILRSRLLILIQFNRRQENKHVTNEVGVTTMMEKGDREEPSSRDGPAATRFKLIWRLSTKLNEILDNENIVQKIIIVILSMQNLVRCHLPLPRGAGGSYPDSENRDNLRSPK